MPKIYHYPRFISEEEVERCLAHLLRLKQSERGGLKTKKMKGSLPVYEIRLNDADRLLLVKRKVLNETSWIILELVNNHDLGKARCLQPQVFKTLFGEDWIASLTSLDEQDFESVEEELFLEDSKVGRIDFFDREPIVLSGVQNGALSIHLPAIITGGPGTGKTLVSDKVKQVYCEERLKSDQFILHVAPTKKLIEERERVWKGQGLQTEVTVHFSTWKNLINLPTNLIDKEEFTKILQNAHRELMTIPKYKASSFDFTVLTREPLKTRYDFSLIAAIGGKTYKNKLGIDQAYYLGVECRDAVVALFGIYQKMLKTRSLIDEGFAELDSVRQYDLVVVDEAQNFTPFQLQSLFKLCKDKRSFVAFLDKEQCVFTAPYIENFLQQFLYDQNNSFNTKPYLLGDTWRCTIAVAEWASIVLAIKHKREGKSSHHYRRIESALGQQGQTFVYPQVDETNHEPLRKLCQSPETVVIANTKVNSPESIRKAIGAVQILDVNKVIGFTFKDVILWNLMDDSNARMSDKLVNEETSLAQISWLNAFFISITRATGRVILIQEPHHDCAYLLDKLLPKNAQDGLLIELDTLDPSEIKVQWQQRVEQYLKQRMYDNAERIMLDKLGMSKLEVSAKISALQGKEVQEEDQQNVLVQLTPSPTVPINPASQNYRNFTSSVLKKWCGLSERGLQLKLFEVVKPELSFLGELLHQDKAQILLDEAIIKKKNSIKVNNKLITLLTKQLLQPCRPGLNLMQCLAQNLKYTELLFLLLKQFEKHSESNPKKSELLNALSDTLMQRVQSENDSRPALLFILYELCSNNAEYKTLWHRLYTQLSPEQKKKALGQLHEPQNRNHRNALFFELHEDPFTTAAVIELAQSIEDWSFLYHVSNISEKKFSSYACTLLTSEAFISADLSTWSDSIKLKFLNVVMNNPAELTRRLEVSTELNLSLLYAFCSSDNGIILLDFLFSNLSEEQKLVYQQYIEPLKTALTEGRISNVKQPVCLLLLLVSGVRPLVSMMDNISGFSSVINAYLWQNRSAIRYQLQTSFSLSYENEKIIQEAVRAGSTRLQVDFAQYSTILMVIKEQLATPLPVFNSILADSKKTEEGVTALAKAFDHHFNLESSLFTQLQYEFSLAQHTVDRFIFGKQLLSYAEVAVLMALYLSAKQSHHLHARAIEVIQIESSKENPYFLIVLNRNQLHGNSARVGYLDSDIIDVQTSSIQHFSELPQNHPLKIGLVNQEVKFGFFWTGFGLFDLIKDNFNPEIHWKKKDEMFKSLALVDGLIRDIITQSWLNLMIERKEAKDSDFEHINETLRDTSLSELREVFGAQIDAFDLPTLKKAFLDDYKGKGSLLSFYTIENRESFLFAMASSHEKTMALLIALLPETNKEKVSVFMHLLTRSYGIVWLNFIINRFNGHPVAMTYLLNLFLTPLRDDLDQEWLPINMLMVGFFKNENNLNAFQRLLEGATPEQIIYAFTFSSIREDLYIRPVVSYLVAKKVGLESIVSILYPHVSLIKDWSFAFEMYDKEIPFFYFMMTEKSLFLHPYQLSEEGQLRLFKPLIESPKRLSQAFSTPQGIKTNLLKTLMSTREIRPYVTLLSQFIPNFIEYLDENSLLVDEKPLTTFKQFRSISLFEMVNTQHGVEFLDELQRKNPKVLTKSIQFMRQEHPLSEVEQNTFEVLVNTTPERRQLLMRLGIKPRLKLDCITPESIRTWFNHFPQYASEINTNESNSMFTVYFKQLSTITSVLKRYLSGASKSKRTLDDLNGFYARSLDRLFSAITALRQKSLDLSHMAVLLGFSIKCTLGLMNKEKHVMVFFKTPNHLFPKIKEFYVVINPVLINPFDNPATYYEESCQVIDVNLKQVYSGRSFIKKIEPNLTQETGYLTNLSCFWTSWEGFDELDSLCDLSLTYPDFKNQFGDQIKRCRDELLQLFLNLQAKMPSLPKLEIASNGVPLAANAVALGLFTTPSSSGPTVEEAMVSKPTA